mgnify:CR=1 FL=1
MKLRLRTLALLALLTLLQGMGPLLHAHVGGQFVRTGTHLHLASLLPVGAAAPSAEATLAGAHEQDSFQLSETAEVGLGLVIERRLLLVATSDSPALPAPLWGLMALPVGHQALLPVRGVPALSLGRNAAWPPPSNAPPTHHS